LPDKFGILAIGHRVFSNPVDWEFNGMLRRFLGLTFITTHEERTGWNEDCLRFKRQAGLLGDRLGLSPIIMVMVFDLVTSYNITPGRYPGINIADSEVAIFDLRNLDPADILLLVRHTPLRRGLVDKFVKSIKERDAP
jgi:hypothetical protein